jgi:hypothetical protein
MPVIPTLGRQRQEDREFKAILSHTMRPCVKTLKKKNKELKNLKK